MIISVIHVKMNLLKKTQSMKGVHHAKSHVKNVVQKTQLTL